jgi:heme/copper-type cytochrome/quinol oxidase subunit 4
MKKLISGLLLMSPLTIIILLVGMYRCHGYYKLPVLIVLGAIVVLVFTILFFRGLKKLTEWRIGHTLGDDWMC